MSRWCSPFAGLGLSLLLTACAVSVHQQERVASLEEYYTGVESAAQGYRYPPGYWWNPFGYYGYGGPYPYYYYPGAFGRRGQSSSSPAPARTPPPNAPPQFKKKKG